MSDSETEESQYKRNIEDAVRKISQEKFNVDLDNRSLIEVINELPVTKKSVKFLSTLFEDEKYQFRILITYKSFYEKLKKEKLKREELKKEKNEGTQKKEGTQVQKKWAILTSQIYNKIGSLPKDFKSRVLQFFSFFNFNVKQPSEKKDQKQPNSFIKFILQLENYYRNYLEKKSYQHYKFQIKQLDNFISGLKMKKCPFKQLCVYQLRNKIYDEQLKIKQNFCQQLCCRTQFILKEKLGLEAQFIEFKNKFYPPFNAEGKWRIKKTICAFLNTRGGFLFFGIADQSGIVEGIQNYYKNKDKLVRQINNLLCEIYPYNPSATKVQCTPIPIYKDQNYKQISQRFVLRVKVKPGGSRQLYFFSHLRCFNWSRRQDGHVITHNFHTWIHEFNRRREEMDEENESILIHFNKQNPIFPQSKFAVQVQKKKNLFQQNEVIFFNFNCKQEDNLFNALNEYSMGKFEGTGKTQFKLLTEDQNYQQKIMQTVKNHGKNYNPENIIFKLGPYKLRVYFEEGLVEIARSYFEKELNLTKINYETYTLSDHQKSYSRGKFFIFQGKQICSKVPEKVHQFRQILNKGLRIEIRES